MAQNAEPGSSLKPSTSLEPSTLHRPVEETSAYVDVEYMEGELTITVTSRFLRLIYDR